MEDKGSRESRSVLAIVGLVVGVVALATSFMPFINNMSFVLGIVGLAFAVVGLVGILRGRHSGRGLAIASIVINVLALVFVLASQSAYSSAIDNAFVNTSDGSAASSSAGPGNASNAGSQAGNAASGSSDKYSIADEQLSKDSYSSTVTGTFTNTSGKELSYVNLTYTLYDADGNQVGNAYASTNNLADGSSWKYEAYCDADASKIATYKLADVSAY